MLFTSFEFIFLFLPVVLIGYLAIARYARHPNARLAWLALASLFFYGYWDYHFLPIILTSIAVNYAFGIIIATHHRPRDRRIAFILAVLLNLGALAFYKYLNFGIGTLNGVTGRHHPLWDVVLPLGISFFTFTQIAYLADVYGGYPVERGFTKYALFVTYFPHLIAGPILHHGEMMPQFADERASRFSSERVGIGLTIFAIGLFKKAVIADGFALIANPVFAAAVKGPVAGLDAWAGALAYALQIYFDFSGYSDMAVGLSLMFGIRLPFNFDAPYKARSIAEFWRRWHITLSRFLRDYVYIPLGGNRQGEVRRNVNLLATMLLGGLWHGAGWTFVIWGALHGLYLVVNHRWTAGWRDRLGLRDASRTLGYAVASLLLTQLAVVLAWVFFRADTFRAATRILGAMVAGGGRRAEAMVPGTVSLLELGLVAGGYAACILLPNVNAMFERWQVGLDTYRMPRRPSLLPVRFAPTLGWAVATASVLLVGIVASLIAGDGSQFLYFQF